MPSVNWLWLLLLVFVCSSNSLGSVQLEPTPKYSAERSDPQSPTARHHRRIFFVPFARPLKDPTNLLDDGTNTCSSNDDDFPYFMSEEQVLHGGIVLVIAIGLYGFTLLAVVCDGYFLPCVETICEKLNLSEDVAAATFMSIATSTPEFFTNVIGTFITESDLGIGTIVGSSLFNALGVPAVGGLNSPYPLKLDWFPLTRDSIIYAVSVSVLITITWDGLIYWYETLIPLGVYILYFIIMFNNKRIMAFVKSKIKRKSANITDPKRSLTITIGDGEFKPKKSFEGVAGEDIKPKASIMSAYGTYMEESSNPENQLEHQKALEQIQKEEKEEVEKSLFRRPEGSVFKKILFYYTWPLKVILKFTVPNPKTHPNWFPLTFLMCIVWIGINSYVVSWMISLIGMITKLPDALLGMTLMAIGGCLPETVSMTIIARRGEGAFGVSNSLGANTMNVLYSLGLPWLFKNIVNGLSSEHPIKIQSGSLEYSIMSLIFAVGILYVTLLICKFRLSKISGSILGFFYLCFVALAVISQTVFFESDCS